MTRAAVVRAALVCVLCATAGSAAARDMPVTVFYDEASAWRPYVFPPDAPQRGALRDAVRLVFDMAGVPLNEAFASRSRAWSAHAEARADVGFSALSWDRGRAADMLLSATLMRTSDRLIFAQDVAYPFRRCDDFADRVVWGVTALRYPCDAVAPEHRISNERGLIFRVAKGDIPAAIIEHDVARYWARRLGVGLMIGPVVETADIRLTLSRSRRALLRRLNIAIFEAVRYGRIAEIKRRYLIDAGLAKAQVAGAGR